MALFGDALVQEALTIVRQRFQELGSALGERTTQQNTNTPDQPSSLQHDLQLLVDVANGVHRRTDERVHQVEQALMRLLDLLLGNALHSRASYPDNFWRTDLGIVVSRVRWWVSGEDLITISNAAALAFGENTQANRMRIARAMRTAYWIGSPIHPWRIRSKTGACCGPKWSGCVL